MAEDDNCVTILSSDEEWEANNVVDADENEVQKCRHKTSPLKPSDVEVMAVTEHNDTSGRPQNYPKLSTGAEIQSHVSDVRQTTVMKFDNSKNKFSECEQSKLCTSKVPSKHSNSDKLSEHSDIGRISEPERKSRKLQVSTEERKALETKGCLAVSDKPSTSVMQEAQDASSSGDKEGTPAAKESKSVVNVNRDSSTAALRQFFKHWRKIKSSKEDDKIKEKLWKYHGNATPAFTESKTFLNKLEELQKHLSAKNCYLVVNEIKDLLKQNSKSLQKNDGKDSGNSPGKPISPEELKRQKKLQKVEKMMIQINKKIQELEEAEVDLDDEDNSTYLVQERLKEQFVKLDRYYCKLAECSKSTGRPVEKKFSYQGSRYQEINARITYWVNKYKEFPDYKDVLNLVRKVTKESNLPLRPETVRVEAQEIFRDVGKILKERRQHDDLYCIYAYVKDTEELQKDPANEDVELRATLRANAVEAKEKLDNVFQTFVDKEAELKAKADEESTEKSGENSEVCEGKTTDGDSKEEEHSDNDDEEADETGKESEEDSETEKEDLDEVLEVIYDGFQQDKESQALDPKDAVDEEVEAELQFILQNPASEESEEDVSVAESPVRIEDYSDEETTTFLARAPSQKRHLDDEANTRRSKRTQSSSPEIVELDC